MAQNDKAVLTAATGYVFIAQPGTPAPTPTALAALDPETYGAQVQTVTVAADGGTFSVKHLASETPVNVAFNASPALFQQALESLDSIGVGNVIVGGTSLSAGLTATFIGPLQGEVIAALTVNPANLTGTTKTVTATITTPTIGWEPIGHTSRNDMPEFGFDGGDSEVKGSWQNPKLREIVTQQVADYLTLFLHQFDTDALELYYGKDAAEGIDGVFGVDGDTSEPYERAFLVIIVDGAEKLGFYAAKANVRRDDAIQMPVDDLAALPIRATFLKMPGRRLFDWINEKLFRA